MGTGTGTFDSYSNPQRVNGALTTATNVPMQGKNTVDTESVFGNIRKLRETPVEDLIRAGDTQEVSAEQKPVEDDEKLLDAFKKGDKAAGNQLLRQVQPSIDSALKSYAGGNPAYMTKARLLALDAFRTYDKGMGTKIGTHVYNHLHRLSRVGADRGNFIHMPEKSALERQQLERIKKDYTIEHGVEPSLSMLSDLAGMDIRKVSRLSSMFGSAADSAAAGESGEFLRPARRTALELYTDSMYNELDETNKKIYEWSTGYRGSPRLDRETIAKKLGMSQAAVSQRASKIDKQISSFEQTMGKVVYGGGGNG